MLAGLNRPPILFYRKSVNHVPGLHLELYGAPGRIRTSDRLVRRHTSWFMQLYDNNIYLLFLIPNKFPLGRPQWAYLAVSGARLLGTVLRPFCVSRSLFSLLINA